MTLHSNRSLLYRTSVNIILQVFERYFFQDLLKIVIKNAAC